MNQAVVWTIAGSDSSAGAGLQADLKVFASFGVRGASLVTAITAQSLASVQAVETVSEGMLDAQWQALAMHPPDVIKIGMLRGAGQIRWLASRLQQCPDVPVVCDPVLQASDGTPLQLADVREVFLRELLPHITLLTPNFPEAHWLLGNAVAEGANAVELGSALLQAGARAVLVKGGHAHGVMASDYFCTSSDRFWMHHARLPGHIHGSGCILSSAIAAALAQGYALDDAVVLGKRYLSQGWRQSAGDGWFVHAGRPCHAEDMPCVSGSATPVVPAPAFPAMGIEPMGLYPVVDSVAWLHRLLPLGVNTIQLRIKEKPIDAIRRDITEAVALGRHYGARVFINDYWQHAIEAGAFGVHLGQEDLDTANIEAIRAAGMRLGLSNHSEREIARAHALKPSYMALGPIYETTTKVMRFAPQGVQRLEGWVRLLQGHYPLVAIGGIDLSCLHDVLATGVGNVAVVRAITDAGNPAMAVRQLQSLITCKQ